MHVGVRLCVHHSRTWGVFLYHPLPYCLETGSAAELKLSSVGWSGSELCGSAHLCPTVLKLQTWASLPSCFTQGMGIQTQVLMLAEQLFLPPKPSHQHKPVRVQIHILTSPVSEPYLELIAAKIVARGMSQQCFLVLSFLTDHMIGPGGCMYSQWICIPGERAGIKIF